MADDISNQTEPDQLSGIEAARPHGKIWHFSVALLSAIVPGVGQLILGARRKGMLLIVAFGLFVIAIWPLRLVGTYPGYVILTCAFLGFMLYSSCSALLGVSKRTTGRTSRWWLLLFVPLATAFFFIDYALLFRAADFWMLNIPSTSMEQTLVPGDRFIVDRKYYRGHSPNRGDIVMFYRDRTYFIKRVIAVGGDTIEGKNGEVLLDGQVLSESYIEHINGGSDVPELDTFGPIKVPSNSFFVMGDNRDVSYDSRSRTFGLVPRDTIAGKPLFIYASAADRSGRNLR